MTLRDQYLLLGYATLLYVWAAGLQSCRIDRVRRRAIFEPHLWIWLAGVRLRTAAMLEVGEDPWRAA